MCLVPASSSPPFLLPGHHKEAASSHTGCHKQYDVVSGICHHDENTTQPVTSLCLHTRTQASKPALSARPAQIDSDRPCRRAVAKPGVSTRLSMVSKNTRDTGGPRNQRESEGGEAPTLQRIKAQPALCQNSRVRQTHGRTVNSLIDVLRTFVNGLLFVKGLEQDQNPQSH